MEKLTEIQEQEKPLRQQEIERSHTYRMLRAVAAVMDKYFLDALIGIVPVVGDTAATILVLPFLYVSLFRIRSIPLALAILFNVLLDALIGIIPFWIGNVCDVFHRAHLQNFRLIIGFVEGDREIIRQVNRKAVWMAVGIVVVLALIVLLIHLVAQLSATVVNWLA